MKQSVHWVVLLTSLWYYLQNQEKGSSLALTSLWIRPSELSFGMGIIFNIKSGSFLFSIKPFMRKWAWTLPGIMIYFVSGFLSLGLICVLYSSGWFTIAVFTRPPPFRRICKSGHLTLRVIHTHSYWYADIQAVPTSVESMGFRGVGLQGAGYDVGSKFAGGGISAAAFSLFWFDRQHRDRMGRTYRDHLECCCSD